MSIDTAGHVPLYLQVAQLIRQRIMSGEWQTGDTLPGEHALTARYGVSYSTIRSAIAVLRTEELVMTRRGVGSVVASVPPRITITAGKGDRVRSRMPTPEERRALGIAEGIPVTVVERPGRDPEVFDSGRAEVVFS